MQRISITRTHHRLLADPRRVLAKPFLLGEELLLPGPSRAGLLLERILAIPEARVCALVEQLQVSFGHRHRNFSAILERHYELAVRPLGPMPDVSTARRLLIGAYFSHEYSVEAAALFNPSIVLAPDQSHLASGEARIIMSLRAVGEGHVSSIEFRSGVLDAGGDLRFDPPGTQIAAGERTAPDRYDKALFCEKLSELSAWNDVAAEVTSPLGDAFSLAELEASLARLEQGDTPHAIWFETAKIMRLLAASNYVVRFPHDSEVAERVLFPAGPNESHGMEDARFVRFQEAGEATYYATYTAYDGFQIMPQLIETADFLTFHIATLNGSAAQNKGMAMFPRKVGGKYMMLSRKDRENLYLATSDKLHFWEDATELYRPEEPWELLQIGNCGSPLETAAGWLVLTHGVGAMRQYAIGAMLLDLEDPRRVLGVLREPLLVPDATEREGYVPNVLYTCGGLLHHEQLILPYGFSDAGVGVATVSLPDLVRELLAAGR